MTPLMMTTLASFTVRPWLNIMNWTKQDLDAYLATAEMACEWNVEPG
jgi:hypothetical protein